MKLCIKQEVFSFKDKFYVKDVSGRDVYYVEGEFLTFLNKFHIYNMGGEEKVFLKQNFTLLEPELSVFIGGSEVARIIKKLTFITPKYFIEGTGWQVEGDFFAHDYEITAESGEFIAAINKEWLTWGDCYTIDIANPANTLLALSVMLAIDLALSQSS